MEPGASCRFWPSMVIMHLESPRPGTSAQPDATPKGICYLGFCAVGAVRTGRIDPDCECPD